MEISIALSNVTKILFKVLIHRKKIFIKTLYKKQVFLKMNWISMLRIREILVFVGLMQYLLCFIKQ